MQFYVYYNLCQFTNCYMYNRLHFFLHCPIHKLQFINLFTLWFYDYQVSIVNIIFLSDSDEDPLPPKIRYYTRMQQICTTSVSFNAHVTCFVDISFFLGEDIILYNYCASNFLVLALCNLGQRDWYCSLVRVSSLVLI